MTGARKNGEYNKLRFDWAKMVRSSQHLCSGAKTLASTLCDDYVNRNSGECWPSNETLAAKIGVKPRSVQRHIKSLVEHPFLVRGRRRGKRRILIIQLPTGPRGDAKHDIVGDRPNPSARHWTASKHERDVAPYKEPSINQGNGGQYRQARSIVYLKAGDPTGWAEWSQWIVQNLGLIRKLSLNVSRTKMATGFHHGIRAKMKNTGPATKNIFGMRWVKSKNETTEIQMRAAH